MAMSSSKVRYVLAVRAPGCGIPMLADGRWRALDEAGSPAPMAEAMRRSACLLGSAQADALVLRVERVGEDDHDIRAVARHAGPLSGAPPMLSPPRPMGPMGKSQWDAAVAAREAGRQAARRRAPPRKPFPAVAWAAAAAMALLAGAGGAWGSVAYMARPAPRAALAAAEASPSTWPFEAQATGTGPYAIVRASAR